MTRLLFAPLLISSILIAQSADQASLMRLTRELNTALQNDSLATAAEIASELDDAVQTQHQAWLVRDSDDRVDDVLSWLPDDIESFWVNRSPFVIDGQAREFGERATTLYSVDRLKLQSEGRFYRLLDHRTVRLAIAATRGIRPPQSTIMTPPIMTSRDVVYFYFFTSAVELPPPDESFQGLPIWQTTAKIIGDYTPKPGAQPSQHEDTNWLALAKPNLLIVSNQKDLLASVLDRIAHGSTTRALPANLLEWRQVDRSASFWGLRHYSAESKSKACDAAVLPYPDCRATGVTLQLDTAKQRLEVRYLSESGPKQSPGPADTVRRDFQVDQPQPGVWSLVSDIAARGQFPLHFGIQMLGFGMYR